MMRIYYFTIFTTSGKILYDGIFDNAAEALRFCQQNHEDEDFLDIRIDGINFIAADCVNPETLYTDSSWYHSEPMKVPA